MNDNVHIENDIKMHLAKISEYADTVEIFITIHNNNGITTCYSQGHGNWYARYGQIQQWVKQNELSFLVERKTNINNDFDGEI
jgi:hypothetical protein